MNRTSKNGLTAGNSHPVKKPNYVIDVTVRRSRATLIDVVKALSHPARLDAAVFQSTFKYLETRIFAVFREDPCTAYPLMPWEPGSARLRLVIEAAGFGTVSAAMLHDALYASKLTSIVWAEFNHLEFSKPQKLPTHLTKRMVQLLEVQS